MERRFSDMSGQRGEGNSRSGRTTRSFGAGVTLLGNEICTYLRGDGNIYKFNNSVDLVCDSRVDVNFIGQGAWSCAQHQGPVRCYSDFSMITFSGLKRSPSQ